MSSSSRCKKILVTGGAGFVGRHLTRFLLEKGCLVTVVTRNVLGQSAVENLVLDLLDEGALYAELSHRNFDGVVHLASTNEKTRTLGTAANNVTMFANLLDALSLNDLTRIVVLGSADQYGQQEAPQSERTRTQPLSPYALSKSIIDLLCNYTSQNSDLQIVRLRPFLIYGPGQPETMFLSQLIRCCLERTNFIMSHGRQIRDFIYVDDVCRAIYQALTIPKLNSDLYTIGTGNGTALWDLVNIVLELTGAEIEIERGGYSRSNDPLALVADIKLANQELNWSPNYTLEYGLTKMIESYYQHAD